MSDSALARFYHTYLDDQDSARFIKSVAARYRNTTLCAIALRGDVELRRASILALGYLGDFSANSVMGRALSDEDRGVRLVSESGIRNVWMSDGTSTQRKQLAMAERLIVADELSDALRIIQRVQQQQPRFAEATRLLGVVRFGQGRVAAARTAFRQAVIDNPYQFQAAIGLANCNARQGNSAGALRWFRRALRINPELEMIRLHVAQLLKSDNAS